MSHTLKYARRRGGGLFYMKQIKYISQSYECTSQSHQINLLLVLKNNIEIFEKLLKRKHGANLIICKASLFLMEHIPNMRWTLRLPKSEPALFLAPEINEDLSLSSEEFEAMILKDWVIRMNNNTTKFSHRTKFSNHLKLDFKIPKFDFETKLDFKIPEFRPRVPNFKNFQE